MAPYQKLSGHRIGLSADPTCPDQDTVTSGIYRYRVTGRDLA